jgi:hypothetical protein
VYVRQVEEQVLTLIVSGKLWRNSLIMQDKESGSLWSHITGKGMEGPHTGAQLEQIPAVQTTWAQWQAEHPDTRVLKKTEEVKSSQYQSYFDDPERNGLFRTIWLEDRMPGKSLVHGVAIGPHAMAVADELIPAGESVEYDLAGIPLKLIRSNDGGMRAVRTDTGEEILVRTSFWFAWSGFYPNTEVME